MGGAQTRSVVVPTPPAQSAVTCFRSLGRRDVRTVGATHHERSVACCSRYCDETVVVPSPVEDFREYESALLSLARRDDVRAILPTSEANVYALSKNRDQFETHVSSLWPTFDVLRTAHDRLRLIEAATEAGVTVPETRLLDDVERWERELVIKARFCVLTDDYTDALSPETVLYPPSTKYLEPGTKPDLDAVRSDMEHTPLVQEYVPGPEYSFWALYDRGDPVATCQKHQVRGDSYAGGTSVYRETVRIPDLEATGRALLDQLDWHGFAAVQFKRDARTDEFKLLEVNPRVWVSMSCAVQAGADFPYYYWQLANGHRERIRSDYSKGVGTHTPIGEVKYLRSVLRDDYPLAERPSFGDSVREVLSSLWNQPHVEYLSVDDPLPFVCGFYNELAPEGEPRFLEKLFR